jgi:hypothetical protein
MILDYFQVDYVKIPVEIKVNHYQKREKNICPKCNSIMMFVVGHFRKPRWPALMKGNY